MSLTGNRRPGRWPNGARQGDHGPTPPQCLNGMSAADRMRWRPAERSVTGTTLCPRRALLLLPCPQVVHRWWINCGNLCPRADHLVSMNTEPTESIIYGSRYSAGRLSLADRWIRAMEDPDIRVVRDRFEAFVQVGSVVTVTGVAVEDPATERRKPGLCQVGAASARVRRPFVYRDSLSRR